VQAIQKGNVDGARIHAENAIREKNQSLNFLRMGARVDAVAQRVQTAVTMNKVTSSMSGVVKGMEKASKSMNLVQMTPMMDKFEQQFENLDVQASYAVAAGCGWPARTASWSGRGQQHAPLLAALLPLHAYQSVPLLALLVR